jgi:hypothetical protein
MSKVKSTQDKFPKCQKTLTGKHFWRSVEVFSPSAPSDGQIDEFDQVGQYQECSLCGIIDDRKSNKHG